MTAFRDHDQTVLAVFKTHVSIAESLLDVVADAGARLAAVTLDQHTAGASAELLLQRREAWGNLWTQLDEARRIAANMGRNLSAFDAARARVGNVYFAAAGMQKIEPAMLDAAAEAIDALRAAVPEVVIPQPPDSEYRNRVRYVPAASFENPAYRRALWIILVLISGFIVSLRFFEC